MGTHLKNPLVWLHGLIAAFIGGGATTLSAQTGLALAHAAIPEIQTLDLKQMGSVFIMAGITNAVLYLKKSPVPEIETTDTQFHEKQND